MPYSNRGLMKLWVRQAIKNLNRAAGYFLRLRGLYDPTHPEVVEILDVFIGALSNLIDEFDKFRQAI